MIDWGLVGWIATAALAVIAIVVTIVATRRWGNRRAVARWYAEVTPLLPETTGRRGLLGITYRDIPVDDPVLVTFAIANIGPRDITTEMFDSGRSIRVHLGATFYGITQKTGDPALVSWAIGTPAEEAKVELQPRLFKRREAWSFSAIVSGMPTVEVQSPLIDTDLKHLIPVTDLADRGLLGEFAMTFTGVLGEMAALLVGRRR